MSGSAIRFYLSCLMLFSEGGLQTYSPTILFGLFKNATKCVLDPPKVVHFWTPHAIAFFYISLVERYSVSVRIGNMLSGNASFTMSSVVEYELLLNMSAEL